MRRASRTVDLAWAEHCALWLAAAQESVTATETRPRFFTVTGSRKSGQGHPGLIWSPSTVLTPMPHELASRLDQWLWAVRAFRSRSLATAAIKSGRVLVDGRPTKPAHTVRPGELITLRMGLGASQWIRSLQVTDIPVSRIGAPLVPKFAADLTPPEELQKSKTREPFFPGWRPKGAGRPTKRDRREIDGLGL